MRPVERSSETKASAAAPSGKFGSHTAEIEKGKAPVGVPSRRLFNKNAPLEFEASKNLTGALKTTVGKVTKFISSRK